MIPVHRMAAEELQLIENPIGIETEPDAREPQTAKFGCNSLETR